MAATQLDSDNATMFEGLKARAAFVRLEAVFATPLPEDDDGMGAALSAERQRRSELFLQFLEKYRDELLEIDFGGETVDEKTAELRALKETSAATRQEFEQAQEALYQSTANVGEAEVEMRIATFQLMSELEALSEEQLSEMPIEERLKIADLVLGWVTSAREQCLAQLPIASWKAG